jgi:DNA repair protein RadC
LLTYPAYTTFIHALLVAGHFNLNNMIQTENIAEIELVYKPSISNKPIISSPLDAYNVLIDFYPKDTMHLQEHFFVAYLNRFNRVLGVLHLSSGGITGTIADIRLIFGTALKAAASGIIISHNHPSGQLNPSQLDKNVTTKIREAGDMLDIKLMDHIIIGHEGKYLSFSDEGL